MTEGTENTGASAPVDAFVMRLRASAGGRYLWRVQEIATKAWCMEFEDWEKYEAEQYWKHQRSRFTERFNGWELARVHYLTPSERLMLEAADMLEFFFDQMQMHSPDMGGNHSYRFRSSGWPMTHCKGPNAEQAVRAAIEEIQRSRSESV